jgi:hypothetical protein
MHTVRIIFDIIKVGESPQVCDNAPCVLSRLHFALLNIFHLNWLLTLREERRLRVFENRMLRRIFGPRRDEVTGNLVIISRRMRWTGHAARMGNRRCLYRVLVGNLTERNHLQEPGVEGRIILRWIFRKWGLGLDRADSG